MSENDRGSGPRKIGGEPDTQTRRTEPKNPYRRKLQAPDLSENAPESGARASLREIPETGEREDKPSADSEASAHRERRYAHRPTKDTGRKYSPNINERAESELEQLNDDLISYDEFGRPRKVKKIRRKSRFYENHRVLFGWVISIAAAVAIALILRLFVVEVIMVDGDSMLPTIMTDERIAIEKVSRYFGLPERGDIIIVRYPNTDGTFVKRVVGLPGDQIEIKDSTLYLNGVPQYEDYITQTEYKDEEAIIVPEGHVYVMGDNRANSMDSRSANVGPIPADQIVGHAMFIIWPLSNIHSIQ